ncbi:hypothetical protein [Streptomyces sp. XY413]|uniref:hypothetical protein n=1 Tax=Streptomyces sp. XY413 TaxID=1519479 RepID=UPI001F3EE231|nr:hypothetical protein [Streptomyces sp. XY413]
MKEAAAKASCPSCGLDRVLQNDTGRCITCSRVCKECGHPVRSPKNQLCGECRRKAGQLAGQRTCPRCGKLGYLREMTGWCGHCSRSTVPDANGETLLVDHRHLMTTQAYYRIGQDRRREAIDRVTALQFDRHGNRVWRKAQGLLDSEHVRREIGEVATAYGVCREPTNVAAGGQSPLKHYTTDISYLPDLEAYLADLLRSREKLMSAFEADDWARSEAMPSEEEVRRVRRLISRIRGGLDDLGAEERAQIEQAVSTVRRGRGVMLGMPGLRRIGQPLPDVRPRRSM